MVNRMFRTSHNTNHSRRYLMLYFRRIWITTKLKSDSRQVKLHCDTLSLRMNITFSQWIGLIGKSGLQMFQGVVCYLKMSQIMTPRYDCNLNLQPDLANKCVISDNFVDTDRAGVISWLIFLNVSVCCRPFWNGLFVNGQGIWTNETLVTRLVPECDENQVSFWKHLKLKLLKRKLVISCLYMIMSFSWFDKFGISWTCTVLH